MFQLKGKIAVVTGGRRGMGRAHALALADRGAFVVVTDVDEQACGLVVEEITARGGSGLCFKMDVSRADEVNSVFDRIMQQCGRVDVLINNAGIYVPKPALEMTEKEWDTMIGINLKGQFLCAQRAAKEMAKNKWGRIVNIASIASGGVGVGFFGAAHYTASKGGIIGMSETLAVEWAPLGITVNVIAPGAIDTPMMDASSMSPEALKALMAGIPLGRVGKPEEVSAAIVFLASEEASYITGATLYVDGGWLAS